MKGRGPLGSKYRRRGSVELGHPGEFSGTGVSETRSLSSFPIPAKWRSVAPRPPKRPTSLPLGWKVKTQQDLLSTTMICPFRSTATPLGPMRRPAPSLVWRKGISVRGFIPPRGESRPSLAPKQNLRLRMDRAVQALTTRRH